MAAGGGYFADITIICKLSQRDPLKVQRYYVRLVKLLVFNISYFAPGRRQITLYTRPSFLRRLHFLISLLRPLASILRCIVVPSRG